MSHLLTWRRKGVWPILQPATRSQIKMICLHFWKLSSLFPLYGFNNQFSFLYPENELNFIITHRIEPLLCHHCLHLSEGLKSLSLSWPRCWAQWNLSLSAAATDAQKQFPEKITCESIPCSADSSWLCFFQLNVWMGVWVWGWGGWVVYPGQ